MSVDMIEANKILLAQKRKQLQLQLDIQHWLPKWLPIFNAVRQLNQPWSFEYVDCVEEADLPFWEKALAQEPLSALGIPGSAIKTPADHYVHRNMEELFPGILPVRYMPALRYHVNYENDTAMILSQAAATLHIPPEQEVYFFYTRFTPVIRLPFSSISLLNEEEIMIPENICIMAIDLRFLIFRSLEYEWTWGSLKPDNITS